MGTPTPEPPDNLPRPDESRIFGPLVAMENVDVAAPLSIAIPVVGSAGAVQPNREVWVLNLARSEAPVSVLAKADGSFRAELVGSPNDRVRIVSRSATQHSLPLDTRVIAAGEGRVALAQLPSEGLSCLTVKPEDELTAVVSAGKDATRRFELTSTCAEDVELKAGLRIGDAGFAIDAPDTLPARGRATITVRITGHDDPRERADVLLLDVTRGDEIGRYALGLWSVSSSSLEE